jgi:hypothetical protein
VQWRLVWFRLECAQGTIETEEIQVDLDREMTVETTVWDAQTRKPQRVQKTAKGYARFRATVCDGKGGRATATGSECAADFPDFIEKAETKAVGRALAMLGYGSQFAPDFDEAHRIVDAPIPTPPPSQIPVAAVPEAPDEQSPAPVSSPEEMEKLRSEFAEAFGIPAEEVGPRWPKFVSWLLKTEVPDDELLHHQIGRLKGAIAAQKRKKPRLALVSS